MALPFLILGALELGLRVAGRHRPTGFWVPAEVPGKIDSNPHFSVPYLGETLARMPRPLRIDRTPPPETLRILVLGESAALGDPEPAFGLPRFIEVLLAAQFPGKRIEVINAAVTAVNSYAMREVARASRDLGADFWVIYPGNNEVLGPFGPGSRTPDPVPSRTAVLLRLALQRTAIGQWLATPRAAHPTGLGTAPRWAGLESFAGHRIAREDPRLLRVQAHYQANLADTIRVGVEAGAHVILGTMVVNLRDCPPFASLDDDSSASSLAVWESAVRAARAATEAGDPNGAVTAWTEAARLRPEHAETRYQLGLAREKTGNAAETLSDLQRARDLDTLRFRADSGILAATRAVATGWSPEHLTLVEAERSWSEIPIPGPPGAESFYEHVHLRPEGNYRLARLFATAIATQISGTNDLRPWPTLAECQHRLGWTPHAEARIWQQIRQLCQRPPFSAQSNQAERERFQTEKLEAANTAARQLTLGGSLQHVQAVLAEHPEDWQLREQSARLWHAGRRWTNAANEWRTLVTQVPGHVMAWFHLGEALARLGERTEAASAYTRALALRPDFVDAHLGLGLVRGEAGDLNGALAAIDAALRWDPHHLEARINRGLTWEALGERQRAVADLRRAAEEHPETPLPWVRLGELFSARQEFSSAVDAFRSAAQRDPENAALVHRLAVELGRAGQLAPAEAAFRDAARLDPGNPTRHFDLGVALAQQQRWAEAITAFETVLRLQPDHPAAANYLDRAKNLQDKAER